MKIKFQQQNLGIIFPVLWEGQTEFQQDGCIKIFGYTPNYLRVSTFCKTKLLLENQIIPSQTVAIKNGELIAEIED